MAGTTADKLAKLEETKAAIKDAIINKGVTIPDGTTFRQYAGKIGEIVTGVDTSDANATEADLFLGKTAYVGGEKITGTAKISRPLTGFENGESAVVLFGYAVTELSQGKCAVCILSAQENSVHTYEIRNLSGPGVADVISLPGGTVQISWQGNQIIGQVILQSMEAPLKTLISEIYIIDGR